MDHTRAGRPNDHRLYSLGYLFTHAPHESYTKRSHIHFNHHAKLFDRHWESFVYRSSDLGHRPILL